MKTFLVGDTVPFRVRTNGDPTSDNPTATVYDQANSPVVPALTIGSGLTAVPGTKIIVGSFVPDAEGEWSVSIVDDTGMDRIKEFIVRGHSVESIGGGINALGALITAQDLVLASIAASTSGGSGHFG